MAYGSLRRDWAGFLLYFRVTRIGLVSRSLGEWAAMALEFQGGRGTGWCAPIGRITIFVDDRDGRPDPAQVAFADRLANVPEIIEKQAAQYLDMFVDRARACGNANEPWWFEDIELRHLELGTCHLAFTLDGDDGGLWTVEMVERHETLWPVRIERRKG